MLAATRTYCDQEPSGHDHMVEETCADQDWEPSCAARDIMVRFEEHLRRQARGAELAALQYHRKGDTHNQESSERRYERALAHLDEIWCPPPRGTMDYHDALRVLRARASKHYDPDEGPVWVTLSPYTLKTLRHRVPELRRLVYLSWQEDVPPDTMYLWDAQGTQVLEKLVVVPKGMGLTPCQEEMYQRLRLDGMGLEDVLDALRLLLP